VTVSSSRSWLECKVNFCALNERIDDHVYVPAPYTDQAYRKVSGQVAVPLVDCAQAAIKAIEALQARATAAGHFGWLSPRLTRQLAGGKLWER
jgi:hypothetical protein